MTLHIFRLRFMNKQDSSSDRFTPGTRVKKPICIIHYLKNYPAPIFNNNRFTLGNSRTWPQTN